MIEIALSPSFKRAIETSLTIAEQLSQSVAIRAAHLELSAVFERNAIFAVRR